ncbi:hypothetical protein EG327_005901 [Venturia inaequalis]|uniref:Methyltransferase n=1 Tax=Venturia inaequalis TaxID=5025 RepID=A0A8H3Z1Y3_VENIN|nr:hypothetical protein EG327_005901 [Venturia inaequalis]
MAPEDPASKPVSDDQEALAPHAPMDPDEAIAADSDGSGGAGDSSSETDADLGIDNESFRSASVGSSVFEYKYENGRRYHSYREGKYMLPNDEPEQDRLDLHHHVFRLILRGALHRAPIKPEDVHRVLDFGTGTGIWAIDFADGAPNAHVIGTDLSPIQPQFVPPNCNFYVDDVESEWTYSDDEKFDFIHGRSMGGGIGDWARLHQQAFEHLKPGGWFEMQEYEAWVGDQDDPDMTRAPNIKKWVDLVVEASIMFGKSVKVAKEQRQFMIDAGFTDVQDDVFTVNAPASVLSAKHGTHGNANKNSRFICTPISTSRMEGSRYIADAMDAKVIMKPLDHIKEVGGEIVQTDFINVFVTEDNECIQNDVNIKQEFEPSVRKCPGLFQGG